MRNSERHYAPMLIICLVIAMPSLAGAAAEPNAADLVREVRAGEDWLDRIQSLQFRVEGSWTHPPQSIAIRRAKLKQGNPDREPDPRYDVSLRPRATDSLEYAIDFAGHRLRYVENSPRNERFLHIWDGEQLISYLRAPDGHEEYNLRLTKESIDRIFGSLSWPRAQPHSFWWAPEDVDRLMGVFGRPEDFRMAGTAQYRGVDCYLLEFDPCSPTPRTYQWYVGRDDHRLYGRFERFIEHWTLDYQEVAPDCWLPMTQGYAISYTDPNSGKPYLSVQRDARLLDVHVNEDLAETLFEMEWKEGIYVTDWRSGQAVVSKYQDIPPSLLGQPLPDVGQLGIDGLAEQAVGKAILLACVDIGQRPSRHSLTQLAAAYDRMRAHGVVVVAVDVSGRDEESLGRWKREQTIPFPLEATEGEIAKTRRTWGVRSLPWLTLADRDHVVVAEGFSLEDLDTHVAEIER